MKLVGDVPQEHRELAVELRTMERAVDLLIHSLSGADKARAYVAMAHDWCRMGAEEEGHKLLLKAEKVCPGYFVNEINQHVKESEDFHELVNNLTAELRWIILQGLRNGR